MISYVHICWICFECHIQHRFTREYCFHSVWACIFHIFTLFFVIWCFPCGLSYSLSSQAREDGLQHRAPVDWRVPQQERHQRLSGLSGYLRGDCEGRRMMMRGRLGSGWWFGISGLKTHPLFIYISTIYSWYIYHRFINKMIYLLLLGGDWNMAFMTSHILGMSSSQLTNSYCSEG